MKVKTNSAGKLIVLASALYCAPFPTAAISARKLPKLAY